MMTSLLRFFMALAAVGLALSVVAHVMAVLGGPIPGGQSVWSLHVGIFVVWLPTGWVSMRVTRGANRKDFWKIMLSGCPPWMRTGLYVLIGYAVLNFAWFIAFGAAGAHDGGSKLAGDVRGFSGHWMIFYAVAFATLYSVTSTPALLAKRTCPNGHAVSVTDTYCSTCGAKVQGGSFGA